jgi:hypothetical protein
MHLLGIPRSGSNPCGIQNQWFFCVWSNFNLINFVKQNPTF